MGFWPRDLITWQKEVVKEVEGMELVQGVVKEVELMKGEVKKLVKDVICRNYH